MDNFIENFDKYLGYFATISAYIIEIIGIIAILIGIGKTIYYIITDRKKTEKHNIKIYLGNALALGLEFKMGAEIIKTVIVKQPTELIVLGAIILLRALLAFLIHWEIKSEKKLDKEDREESVKNEPSDKTENQK